ncbi:hypothetical protein TA3x_005553 [Tundrisphaera sp. TA3]|uniref:hypothetical protein n=1 Tax=Tundrisphaera sp. TA3 TaxID=3435775 RepID=UPI003EC0FBAE
MDPITNELAQHLTRRFESQESVEIRVQTKITPGPAVPNAPGSFDTHEEHYVETAAGQRFCEIRGTTDGVLKSHSIHYGSGTRFADLSFDREDPSRPVMLQIKRHYYLEDSSGRKEVPVPLRFFYVGREPLHEALAHGRHLDEGEVIGRKCELYLFPQVRMFNAPQDQVYYLDRATGTPLKFEFYRDETARAENKTLGVWTAKSVENIQGRLVVVDSTQAAFDPDGNSLGQWKFHVESIAVNRPYPATMFWQPPPPGVSVMDTIANKAYQVPGGAPPAPKKEASVGVDPVRAVAPREWPAAELAAMSGAALLLAVGISLWRRRRGA